MLQASPSWQPMLLLPEKPTTGPYAALSTVPVRHSGVAQHAGASAGGIRVMLDATARLLAQAVAVRMHPGFRTAELVDANTARSAAYGAMAARTSSVPFVVHLRDMTDPDALGRFGFATMTRLVLPRADGIIANSRATLASAAQWVRPHARTAVIVSATGLAHGLARVAHSGPLVVGMLARIDPWKGQELVLDAFAQALPDGSARLQFAGAPLFGHTDFAERLRTRAQQLGIADRVDFLGHVDDVQTLLSSWDVAVHFSTRPEPLGQNVLQYLAAGLATVVADEGGPAEWVTDGGNGFRVAPRDIQSLAAALNRLASSPKLRERLGAAASVTAGLLDDHEVALAHATFYADLLADRQLKPRN
jgi:glycosyltransferase involved in cell wall biosynthesis